MEKATSKTRPLTPEEVELVTRHEGQLWAESELENKYITEADVDATVNSFMETQRQEIIDHSFVYELSLGLRLVYRFGGATEASNTLTKVFINNWRYLIDQKDKVSTVQNDQVAFYVRPNRGT